MSVRPLVLAAPLAVAAILLACGGNDEGDASATPDGDGGAVYVGDAGFDAGYPKYVDEMAGLTIILGTPDLGVGTQRVAFVLSDAEGVVRLPVLTVTARHAMTTTRGEQTQAHFADFPEGVRGLYVTEVTFDEPGDWTLDIAVPRPDGSTAQTHFTFPVAEHPLAPAIGDPAPRSVNRTLADVADVHDLSTGSDPDPALYEQTIAEAIDEGLPLVVVFASPGFCTNALCGPQAEMLTTLRERYGDRANFIHVDLYENPADIRSGGLDVAVETPLIEEWGLATDEWTFVIDGSGIVRARFEAFVPEPELEAALMAMLDPATASR